MTIRHLRIFLAVCRQDSNTTKAAEELHMTQPAVSLALKELEQYYGVILFDRIGRRLKITEAGRHFRDYAQHITASFDDMERGMRNWDSFGILRVGASITIGSQFLPYYVKVFSTLQPGTEIHAKVLPTDQLEEMLMENELDLALIEGISHSSALISEEYMEDRLVILCPNNGRYTMGQTISIEEFNTHELLLREPGSGTREIFERAMEQAGYAAHPIWEAMSTTALVNAVIQGLGTAVLPYRMVRNSVNRGLTTVVKVDKLDLTRRFYILRHKEKLLTKTAGIFLDICRNYEMDYPLPEAFDLY